MAEPREAPPLPIEDEAPPLPPEPPSPEEAPKPPPMPVHMSNQKHEGLDFDCGDGGHLHPAVSDGPVPKRPRLDCESDVDPNEPDFSKNLEMNIEVANAMLAAIANEIKTEDGSPSSVEDGEVVSSDNEPHAAALKPDLPIKMEVQDPPETLHREEQKQPAAVTDGAGAAEGGATGEESSAVGEQGQDQASEGPTSSEKPAYEGDPHTNERQFCPYDVGSHRKPVSQIPVAPPSGECKFSVSKRKIPLVIFQKLVLSVVMLQLFVVKKQQTTKHV